MTQGFTGKIFEILRDLFGKAKSRVKWNSKIGELFENTCGVLQGGTISPTLFNAYIEDMQIYFAGEPGVSIGGLNINHLLQADDLILISETSSGLQRLLDKLSKYCRRWHLLLNVIKTKIMIFDKKYLATQTVSNFTFNDKRIDECTKYKYLGVIFSNQGPRFEENNKYVKDKSTRAMIASKTMVHSAVGNTLPTMLLLKIFNQQIRPILEYAADIWYQNKPIETLERVQTQYIKSALHVRQSTLDLAVYGETGYFPLHMRHQDQLVKAWLRLLRMPDDQHLKAIYNELFELATKGHDNFAQKISVLLSKHNLNIAEIQNSAQEDLRQFELAFREKRYKQYIDNWHRELGSFPKHDIYREIKEDYRVEPYILYIRNKRHQQALARLRVSSHNLYIETGRHSRLLSS